MRRVAIVLVCLAVLIIIGACYFYLHHTGPVPPAAMGTAPSVVSMLPPQAPFVIYADLATLRKSEFLERLVALIPAPAEDPEYFEFVKATGFDYSRDLDRAGMFIEPTQQQTTVGVIAEGRFDQQKIIAYALRTGKTEKREGRTVYVVPNTSDGGETTLSFLAPGRIELVNYPKGENGSNPSAAADAATDQGMQERISRVAASSVFAVARIDALPKNVNLDSVSLDQVATFLQHVQWLSLSAVPTGQNLKVVLDGKCDTAIHAANLQLALQGFKLMGRAMLGQPSVRKQFTPEGAVALTTLIGIIDISRGDQSVALSATFTPDLLTGLAAPPQQHQAPSPKAASTPRKGNH